MPISGGKWSNKHIKETNIAVGGGGGACPSRRKQFLEKISGVKYKYTNTQDTNTQTEHTKQTNIAPSEEEEQARHNSPRENNSRKKRRGCNTVVL